MSLIKSKKTNLPSWPAMGSVLADFFDNDAFFDSDLIRKEWVPAVNIKENEKDFEIELAAPGLNKKDFKISVANGMMTISSEKEEKTEEEKENYTRREFSYRSFRRSFRLPENVDENKIKASYQNGVLMLKVAKSVPGPVKTTKVIEVE
jgi:HSP20 family protein